MVELNAGNALEYARERGLLSPDQAATVEHLAGGVSCEVLRVRPAQTEAFVVKQALPKLRVAADWISDPARIEREVIVMRLAREALGPLHVPQVLDYDAPRFIYSMSSAPLDAVNWKSELLAGRLEEGLAAQCGVVLALFHRIEPRGEDAEKLADKSFFYQLRVEAYLEHSARNAPDLAPELLRLGEELMEARVCLTHADYTPKNFLVSGGILVLLDYEVSHIGHGAFDIASILNHFYLKSLRDETRTSDFGLLSQAFLRSYLEADGPAADDGILWRLLGGLMLARIIGKSPVEYLEENQKMKARATAASLLSGRIRHLSELY